MGHVQEKDTEAFVAWGFGGLLALCILLACCMAVSECVFVRVTRQKEDSNAVYYDITAP